jgi:hypothetical protein
LSIPLFKPENQKKKRKKIAENLALKGMLQLDAATKAEALEIYNKMQRGTDERKQKG